MYLCMSAYTHMHVSQTQKPINFLRLKIEYLSHKVFVSKEVAKLSKTPVLAGV